MKIPALVAKTLSYLPVLTCLLFLVTLIKLFLAIQHVDSAIAHYDSMRKEADSLLSTQKEIAEHYTSAKNNIVDTPAIPVSKTAITPLPHATRSTTINKKYDSSLVNTGKFKAFTPSRPLSTVSNPPATPPSISFMQYDGIYDKATTINRSSKLTLVRLHLTYKMMRSDNGQQTSISGGTLYLTEINRIYGRLITQNLEIKLMKVQGDSEKILCFFKEDPNNNTLPDTSPLKNRLDRIFTFQGTRTENNITGYLMWEDLSDDMMSFYDLKIPLSLHQD